MGRNKKPNQRSQKPKQINHPTRAGENGTTWRPTGLRAYLPRGGLKWAEPHVLSQARYAGFIKKAMWAKYKKLNPSIFRDLLCEIINKAVARMTSSEPDRPKSTAHDLFHQFRWLVRVRQDVSWAKYGNEHYVNFQCFKELFIAIVTARRAYLKAEEEGAISRDSINNRPSPLATAVDRFLEEVGDDWMDWDKLALEYMNIIKEKMIDWRKEEVEPKNDGRCLTLRFKAWLEKYRNSGDERHASFHFGIKQDTRYEGLWNHTLSLIYDGKLDLNRSELTPEYHAKMQKMEADAAADELAMLFGDIGLGKPMDEAVEKEEGDEDDTLKDMREGLDAMALES